MQTASETAMVYEAIPAKDALAEWIVEAIDHTGDGEVYVTRFSGPMAEQRAREYAEWMGGRIGNQG